MPMLSQDELPDRSRAGWIVDVGAPIVIAAGVIMRLIALGDHPYGLYQDEAFNGLDALRVLAGARPLYFPANNGREPFFIYLVAVTVSLFGRTPLGVRAAATICGLLTLPATYLLGRTWVNRRVGLLAAAILAAMLWHVHLSRVGFRAVSLPLFAALMLSLGAHGLKTRSKAALIGAGVVGGLSLYTYLAARFIPLALLLMLVYGLIGQRAWLRERWRCLPWTVGAALITALPLAILAITQPEVVLGRSGQVAIWSPAIHQGDPLGTLLNSILRTLGMFTWRGDPIWRHNVPGRPVFDPLLGIVFWGGAVLGAVDWKRRPVLALSLIWVGVMTLPTLLAEDAPHFLRSVGVLPVVALIPALVLDMLVRRLKLGSKSYLEIGIAGLLALSAALTARDYFGCRSTPPIPLSGYDYVGCYRSDPLRGYFFQAAATDLARRANLVEGTLYLDRRFWDSFPSVRFLVPESDRLRLYDEGQSLDPATPPFSLIAWPHTDLGPTLTILPTGAQITVVPGPETRGDLEPEVYRLYVVWDVAPIDPDLEPLTREPLARFENGLALLKVEITQGVVRLSWYAEQPLREAVHLFAHAVGPDGFTILAQHDEPPGTAYYPPLSWKAGSVIIHSFELDGQPARLLVGLYDPASGQRLTILAARAPVTDGAINLAWPGGSE